jgi:signal transduction histidine kinase
VLAASAPGRSTQIGLNIASGASVKADREKLFRVIANGIRNALDAMDDNGNIRIYSSENSRWVDICIEDTGMGLSEIDHERLFTPFYTTKTDGTGLGLAYAKKVIEGMGGAIKRAEELNVAVLLVPDSTLEAVEKVESFFGRTSLGQPEKLSRFQAMLAEHLDYARLVKDLGL